MFAPLLIRLLGFCFAVLSLELDSGYRSYRDRFDLPTHISDERD